MIQKASLRGAPAVLSMGDKAVWVTGWNEAVDALEAEQAQIDDLRTQLARRAVERDMAIQMVACGEQAQQVAVPAEVLSAISRAGFTLLKNQHGYELRNLGPVFAHTTPQGDKT